MLELARRALGRLSAVPLPREGSLTFVPTPAAAAEGVELVQESAPERLELKQALLAEACAAAGAGRAHRLVDLGPAADRAGSRDGPARAVPGRSPVQPGLPAAAGRAVRRGAHLARRRSSARAPSTARSAWRRSSCARRSTASWPTACSRRSGARRCGSSTTASRPPRRWTTRSASAPGLRWSFMGTFLTYRIAGGEAGMRHFMAQFGPALKWPWTKLMDVPDLTDELLDDDRRAVRRAGGGPQRARARAAARRLPRLGAAGAARARHRGGRRARTARAGARGARPSARVMGDGDDLSRAARPAHGAGRARLGRLQRPRAREPLPAGLRRRLRRALRLPRHRRGVPRRRAATSRSRATSPTCARRCSATGSRSRRRCSTADARRLHVFHSLWREGDGALLATAEQLYLHVDTVARRAAPAAADGAGTRAADRARRTPRCRVPSVRAARSPSRAEASVRSRRR